MKEKKERQTVGERGRQIRGETREGRKFVRTSQPSIAGGGDLIQLFPPFLSFFLHFFLSLHSTRITLIWSHLHWPDKASERALAFLSISLPSHLFLFPCLSLFLFPFLPLFSNHTSSHCDHDYSPFTIHLPTSLPWPTRVRNLFSLFLPWFSIFLVLSFIL